MLIKASLYLPFLVPNNVPILYVLATFILMVYVTFYNKREAVQPSG